MFSKKAHYHLAIPIETLMAFFKELEQTLPKFVQDQSRPRNQKRLRKFRANLSNKSRAGDITALNFKMYCKAIMIEMILPEWRWT